MGQLAWVRRLACVAASAFAGSVESGGTALSALARSLFTVEKPRMVASFRTMERYFSVLDNGEKDLWLLSRVDVAPKKPRHVMLRRGNLPFDLTRGSRGERLVASNSAAQNPGGFFDGGSFVVYGGTNDADNPNPRIAARGGGGVVALVLDRGNATAGAPHAMTSPVVLGGGHEGCVEARAAWNGRCQYDGKVSPVAFRGWVLLYARANRNACCGGRGVQVAAAESAAGPFGPLRAVTFANLAFPGRTDANVYFGAVSVDPVGGRGLLGLFPVNAAAEAFDPPSTDNASCIAVAYSCDGIRFGPLTCAVATEPEPDGRTLDHPVTGFVVRGDLVYAYVHAAVPGIGEPRHRTRILRYAARRSDVAEFANASRALLGCDP